MVLLAESPPATDSAGDLSVWSVESEAWLDARVVLQLACALQFDGPSDAAGQPWPAAVSRDTLKRLGFKVRAPGREAWSRREVELLVTDYLQMLQLYLNGQPLNKAAHRRALLPQLDGRSHGSIEFKRRNVSAVLRQLQFMELPGYVPAEHAQLGLMTEVVLDKLKLFASLERSAEQFVDRDASPDLHADFSKVRVDAPAPRLHAEEPLGAYRQRRPFKVNYVERETHNRELGLAGEKFVLGYEQWRLAQVHGLGQLAERVRHVSVDDGDGLGYDILSFESDGSPRYLEVKTTAMHETTPFYISENELNFARGEARHFRLCRVFDFRNNPRFFELPGPVEQHVRLDPATWRASLA
ncbi:MAG: hypothetical protein RIQ53_1365 [Pseudomonadota bacterium]